MNRKILLFGTLIMVVAFALAPAANARFSKISTSFNMTYLYHKDPCTWCVIDDGTMCTFTWFGDSLRGYRCLFSGCGLDPCEEYALVNYQENWPFVEAVYSVGMSSLSGELMCSSSLPGMVHGKVWLVPTDHLDMGALRFICWNPSEILFEDTIFP